MKKVQTDNEKIIYRTNTVPKAQQVGISCYCYNFHLLLRALSGIFLWLAIADAGCLLETFSSISSQEDSVGCFLVRDSLCFQSSAVCCQEVT